LEPSDPTGNKKKDTGEEGRKERMSHTVERTSRSGRFAELSGLFLRASSILLIVATLNIGNDVYTHPNDKVTCAEDSWVKRVESSEKKIIASSVHKSEGKYTYVAENLLDNRLDTCWCPEGNGIDEFILMKIPYKSRGIRIINGIAINEKLFIMNNRVRKLYVAFIGKSDSFLNSGVCDEENNYAIFYQLTPDSFVELKNQKSPQEIFFEKFENLDWERYDLDENNIYLMIGIIDIYKGTKYNDTCISEIEIIK
jgi:hypothetical protein